MNNTLSDFAITAKWPPHHPDRIQLYSLPTPNGVKVSIMLEETGLPYEVHLVDFGKDDQKTPEFLSLNPNGKIPAILDPNGPGGKPLALFESGAILQYLAEKTGKLIPSDAARRWQAIQWVHFQMGGIGPMFGQVGFFHKFAGKDFEDKRPRERYVNESKRLLGVMEAHLAGRQWFMDDDYTRELLDNGTMEWKCRAGARTFLVDENGLVHLCQPRMGNPGTPLLAYTVEHIRAAFNAPKSCARTCPIAYAHHASKLDGWRSQKGPTMLPAPAPQPLPALGVGKRSPALVVVS